MRSFLRFSWFGNFGLRFGRFGGLILGRIGRENEQHLQFIKNKMALPTVDKRSISSLNCNANSQLPAWMKQEELTGVSIMKAEMFANRPEVLVYLHTCLLSRKVQFVWDA